MKKKGYVGPTKKKTIKGKLSNKNDRGQIERATRFLFFLFLLFASFSDLWKSDRRISLGKERKVLYATRAMRGYQKHRISPRIQVKIWKILNFLFFSDLRRSNGQNFCTRN